jgi:hypothetical protein
MRLNRHAKANDSGALQGQGFTPSDKVPRQDWMELSQPKVG